MKSSWQLAIIAILFLQSVPAFGNDVITNIMSPIASYQLPEHFNDETLTNGGVLSPFVSYQNPEAFSSETLTNGGVSSLYVSYEFQQNVSGESLTNGGVQSPFVSFQYLEDFSSASLTNGGIASPIASYQYYEWPGAGILNLQYSPTVSYYYQFGNSTGTLILHGRVTDASGTSLSDATIAAMIYSSPVAQATTDADGNYQMAGLDAGVYDLSAWDATHQTSVRALTLNANTAEQNFQLQPTPSTPATLQVNRSATVNYSVDAKNSRLLFFNGSVFTNIDGINAPSPNRMTIVLTHGWVSGTPNPAIMNTPFDRWPTNMATQLWAAGITTNIANIVAWDWRYAAMDSSAPSDAVDMTPNQGVALGEALTNFFGTGYSQPIHFIGHSLGTIVNAAAVNFLHGDPNGSSRRPVSSFPWTSPMQMTLFDEAQIAEYIGTQVLQDGLNPTALDSFNSAFADNSPPQNWQSPLPNNYAWADNYQTVAAVALIGAVNILLQKSPYSLLDVDDNHGYPIDWYGSTIVNPIDPKNPLGFQNSYEFDGMNGLPFLAPNIFQQGSIYHQVPTESDPLALELIIGTSQNLGLVPALVLSGVENLWQNTVQIAGQVSVDVENTAQQSAQLVSQDFNYVIGIAGQGGQAIVNVLDPSVLRLILTTVPPATSSSHLRSNGLARPLGISSDNNDSNTPPMIWLPVTIPTDAAALEFDFTVDGDPENDWLVCGIETNNLFSLEAKYIPTNQISASRLIDVSAWAGTTNELFFGFLGDTSTNAILEIDNIRFYSFRPPSLSVQTTNNAVALSWPLSASSYVLESTDDLVATNSWLVVTNAPESRGDQLIIIRPIAPGSQFYRLKQQ